MSRAHIFAFSADCSFVFCPIDDIRIVSPHFLLLPLVSHSLYIYRLATLFIDSSKQRIPLEHLSIKFVLIVIDCTHIIDGHISEVCKYAKYDPCHPIRVGAPEWVVLSS